jgi:hypothetical protein
VDKIQRSHDGMHANDLVSIATNGVYAAINMQDTIARGLIPKVGYPQLRAELPRVRVTLHTDSLAQAQGKAALARDWLVAMGKNGVREIRPTIDLLVTPTRSSQDQRGLFFMLLRHIMLNIFQLPSNASTSFHSTQTGNICASRTSLRHRLSMS